MPPDSPAVDYLARDYAALRTRLLDRLAALVPGWSDRNPADPLVTLVELFAYAGDRLTLWQDAVAAEAYLTTARRRTSVRRHARLLDYRHARRLRGAHVAGVHRRRRRRPAAPHAGAPRARSSRRRDPAARWRPARPCSRRSRRRGCWSDRNVLALHAWGDTDGCLPAGATGAYVLPCRRAPIRSSPRVTS